MEGPEALPERIYELLLKNVSKDSPLSPEELQELKSFRDHITCDDWSHWLKFARKEKKRLASSEEYQQPVEPYPHAEEVRSEPAKEQSIFYLTNPFSGDSRRPSLDGIQTQNPRFVAEQQYPAHVPVSAKTSSLDCPDGVSLSIKRHTRAASAPRPRADPEGVTNRLGMVQAQHQQMEQQAQRHDQRRGRPIAPMSLDLPSPQQHPMQHAAPAHPAAPTQIAEQRLLQASGPPPLVPHQPKPLYQHHQPHTAHPLHPYQQPQQQMQPIQPIPPQHYQQPAMPYYPTAPAAQHYAPPQPAQPVLWPMHPQPGTSYPQYQQQSSHPELAQQSYYQSPPFPPPPAQSSMPAQQSGQQQAMEYTPVSVQHHLQPAQRSLSPLQGLLASFAHASASANSPSHCSEDVQALRTSLTEAGELARAGSSRIDAAYSAAEYLLKNMTKGKSDRGGRGAGRSKDEDGSMEILHEMMFCLDKARSSLSHLQDMGGGRGGDAGDADSGPEDSFPYEARDNAPSACDTSVEVSEPDLGLSLGLGLGHSLGSRSRSTPWKSSLRTPAHSTSSSSPIASSAAAASTSSVVTRVAILYGSLSRAFEEYPIRADLESNSIDCVWREYPDSQSSKYSDPQITLRSPNKVAKVQSYPKQVLRRERFVFDQLLVGGNSQRALVGLARRHCRNALSTSSNCVFICSGVGTTNAIESSVTTALGTAGGTGVVAAIIEEIFAVAPSSISFSAVLVSGHTIVDLLSPVSGGGAGSGISKNPHILIKPTPTLRHTTQISLSSRWDYERIVGLLLGRRGGLLETNSSSILATWDSPGSDDSGVESNNLLLTITVKLSKTTLVFSVIAACGSNWTVPGFDLTALAEVLSCHPHRPPESLLQASPVTALLTHNHHHTTYCSILTVDRAEDTDDGIAAISLPALRIASLPK